MAGGPGQNVTKFGEKGMRLVRSWTTLMILAASKQPLTAREVHDKLCQHPDFAHVEMKLQTTREDLKTLVKCQFPVAMVDDKGRELDLGDHPDLRGRLKNIRWCLRTGSAIRDLLSPPSRPTVADVAALRVMHELLVLLRSPSELLRGPFADVLRELLIIYQNQMMIDEAMGSELAQKLEKLDGAFSENSELRERLLVLAKSIGRGSVVHARYHDVGSRRVDVDFAPRRFFISKGSIHVVGLRIPENELHSIRVDQLARLSVLHTHRAPEHDDQAIEDFIRQISGSYQGSAYQIRLVVHPRVADLFRQTTFHSTQEIQDSPDGGLDVRFHCAACASFEEWLLGFGEYVRVVEPTVLAERMRDRHLAAARAYREHLEGTPPEESEELESPAADR